MEVKELKAKGLKREFSITIKSDVIKNLKAKKLKEIASKAKIDGFRPGKVPSAHIEKLYGQSVIVEVIEEKVSKGQHWYTNLYLKIKLPNSQLQKLKLNFIFLIKNYMQYLYLKLKKLIRLKKI